MKLEGYGKKGNCDIGKCQIRNVTVLIRLENMMRIRIIVPTARQGRSQGENGNVDRFLMPRDSFTFRGRNEEGQLSNRVEQLSARAKQGKTAQRS